MRCRSKMIYTLLLLAPVLAATLVNANIATAQPASPPCVATEDAAAHPSFKQDVGLCKATYRIHPDGLELSVSAPTSGWLGVAFPTNSAGEMHDAWAIIGTKDLSVTLISEFKLTNRPPVHLPNALPIREGALHNLNYMDAALERLPGRTTLEVFVPYNSRIIAETTVPVICAYSPNNSPVVSYHGGNRFQGGLNLACPVDE